MPTKSGLPLPIPVDFLPSETHGLPGRLGLTQAPGTWSDEAAAVRVAPGSRLSTDLLALSLSHGIDALLTLQEKQEMEQLGLERLLLDTVEAGLESLWLPIPDGRAPARPADASATVNRVIELLAEGRTVVIHCLAGLGRSGTLAACILVRLGVRPGTAIDQVRAARPGAIQTSEQLRFISRYVQFVHQCQVSN